MHRELKEQINKIELKCVTFTCVYAGQHLLVAASRYHALLNSVTALIDYECNIIIRGSIGKGLVDVGTNGFVLILSVSVSVSSLLHPGVILYSTVSLHLYSSYLLLCIRFHFYPRNHARALL